MNPVRPLMARRSATTAGIVLLLCTGCATQPPQRTEPVRRDLVLVPWDQVSLWHRVALDFPDTPRGPEEVCAQPRVSATPVGRYADPDDPNLMHEAHIVYRRETGPIWHLAYPLPTPAEPAPRPPDGRLELKTLQLQEVEQRLAAQEQERATLREAVTTLAEAVQTLQRARPPTTEGSPPLDQP